MKKLLLSAVLLLVSAMLLGTSTYAWFSMNKTVSATGMSVEAKSDSAYLLIKAGTCTIAQIRQSKLTTDAAPTASATGTLLPCAHNTIEDIEDADTLTNWYYKVGDSPSGSSSTGDAKSIATIGNYVLINEFSLGLAAGSNDMTDIKANVTITTATGGAAAVHVLVATSEGAEDFAATGSGKEVMCETLSGDSVLKVKIYIYWDGNNDAVFTNNVANLKNTEVTVEFTGTVEED